MAIKDQRCKVCTAGGLQAIPEFPLLPRVTSDCVPFRDGGRLLVCPECSAAQSPADEQWFGEIREIYRSYAAYHQAEGVEQYILDPATGLLRRRSTVLVSNLAALPGVPPAGKVLDVGCGTGGTLEAFAEQRGWRLFGLELDAHNLRALAAIEGFDTLYTCTPAEVPGQFEVVTMVHALEHFPEPASTLRDLRSKIAPDGCLFVEVPNAEQNPFDYLIADHMLHFTPPTLAALVNSAGFTADSLSTNWVPKELSLVAHPGNPSVPRMQPQAADDAVARIRSQIVWLNRFVDAARHSSSTAKSFGLFGTSIAATWLCGVLGDRVSFFVEEDANRIGRVHMGRPMLSPAQTPPDSVVFMALIPPLARRIAQRLCENGIDIDLRLPCDFTGS